MGKLIDLTGMKFGRLTVTGRSERNIHKIVHWDCICECGNKTISQGANLRNGLSKSCGCLRTKHGKSNTSIYHIWQAMLQRCTNSNFIYYKNYGGRGISVCERWHKFDNFYEDMGERPSDAYSIDRVDNDGNYEPSNCKWATHSEQMLNRRKSKKHSSKYRGVSFSKKRNKWIAYIRVNSKFKILGVFNTEYEAAHTYNKYVRDNNLPNQLNFYC